jgi:hypothetical protein
VATTLQLLTATGVDWTVTLYIGVDDYSLRHSLQPRSEFQEAHQSDILSVIGSLSEFARRPSPNRTVSFHTVRHRDTRELRRRKTGRI